MSIVMLIVNTECYVSSIDIDNLLILIIIIITVLIMLAEHVNAIGNNVINIDIDKHYYVKIIKKQTLNVNRRHINIICTSKTCYCY